jgi:hypothetical protein
MEQTSKNNCPQMVLAPTSRSCRIPGRGRGLKEFQTLFRKKESQDHIDPSCGFGCGQEVIAFEDLEEMGLTFSASNSYPWPTGI